MSKNNQSQSCQEQRALLGILRIVVQERQIWVKLKGSSEEGKASSLQSHTH